MRLTLRTLLAYRDGVLSTVDREDLHRRIQQSEDAGNLLKRVNATANRIYGTSPMIVGKGLGGDPNSLAEYLDDVLISEKVPELERICLESDAYLAELASCHTLLSTAMSTRVTVPNAMRQLAIDIGSEEHRDRIKEELNSRKHSDTRRSQIIRADSAHPTNDYLAANVQVADNESREHVVQVPSPMVATGGDTIKQTGLNLEGSQLTREVPEYLVGKNNTSWLIPLSIGALIALLGVLTWKSLGPLERIQELFASSDSSEKAEAGRSLVPPANASDDETVKRDIGEQNAASPNGEEGVLEEEPAPIMESNERPPGLPPANVDASDAASAPDDRDETTSGDNAENVPDAGVGSGENLAEASVSTPPSAANGKDAGTSNTPATQSLTWTPQQDEESESVAFVQSAGGLRRLAAGESLGTADSLVFPPFYRTSFELSNGVQWTACGPTLLSIDESNPAALQLKLGRALLQVPTPGATNSATTINTPVGSFALTLVSEESVASVEIEFRRKSHGSTVDARAFTPVMIVTAVNGQVSISDSRDNANVTLNLGEGIAVVGDSRGKEFKIQSIPPWFRQSYQRPIDKLARGDFYELLSAEAVQKTSLADALVELSAHPKPEVANLAVQTSLLLGDWTPFAQGFLDSPRFRNHWSTTLQLAEQILASRGSNALQTALSTQGTKGDALFAMLIDGQSKEELVANGLNQLVDYLDDDDLAKRVVASYQLQKLTGQRFGYLPHVPNRASVQQWRRELATNRLSLLPIPDVIYERAVP